MIPYLPSAYKDFFRSLADHPVSDNDCDNAMWNNVHFLCVVLIVFL